MYKTRVGLTISLLSSSTLATTRGLRPALFLDFLSGSLDSRVGFSRGTNATFVGSNGLIQTAAINVPRFDYDPVTLAPRGLLIEEQRTNLQTYSADFTNAVWVKTNVTVTAAAAVSPDGTSNAQKIEATASAATLLRCPATAVAATAATFSVYVKQGTGATTANAFLLRNNTTSTNLVGGTLNYSTGVWTYTTGSTGVTVVDAGNGWWRVQIAATSGITSGDSLIGYVGFIGSPQTAADHLFAWGAQLEAGAFATSYIPTVASQVTRNADVATMTGTNFSGWYNQTEGTIIWSGDFAVNNSNRLVSIDAGIAARTADIYGTTAGAVSYYKTSDAQQVQFGSGIALNTVFTAAVAIKLNDYIGAVNGTLGGADTTTGPVATADRLSLGHWNNTGFLNGHIRQIAYFNTRLPDAQLQTLSSPSLVPTLVLDFTASSYASGY